MALRGEGRWAAARGRAGGRRAGRWRGWGRGGRRRPWPEASGGGRGTADGGARWELERCREEDGEEEQERRKREEAAAEEEAVPATKSVGATRGDDRRRIRTGDGHRTSPLPSDPHGCAIHLAGRGEGRGGVGEKRRRRPFPLVGSGRGSSCGGGGNCGGGGA
uniref:Uncharacterized protein n=1 Tax=Oryza rufipogon TaxID=4529 RepID=A0A0E0MTZ9_ORYRU